VGETPLGVDLKAEVLSPDAVPPFNYVFDSNGDGGIDHQRSGVSEAQFEVQELYLGSCRYFPRVTVTDSEGRVGVDDTIVVVKGDSADCDIAAAPSQSRVAGAADIDLENLKVQRKMQEFKNIKTGFIEAHKIWIPFVEVYKLIKKAF